MLNWTTVYKLINIKLNYFKLKPFNCVQTNDLYQIEFLVLAVLETF